jgi:S-(hydroxymethyl)glutathione dehydrogenase/alcohol dehydrogenase
LRGQLRQHQAAATVIVIVIGIVGIGANVLQAAVHAGATTVIAVDPMASKPERAATLAATHSFATMDKAADHLRSATRP